MAFSVARTSISFSSLGAGSTVRESDMGDLDDLLDLLGYQLAAPVHRKLGRTALVDTREFGGKASAKGVHVPKRTGLRLPRGVQSRSRPASSLLTRQVHPPARLRVGTRGPNPT